MDIGRKEKSGVESDKNKLGCGIERERDPSDLHQQPTALVRWGGPLPDGVARNGDTKSHKGSSMKPPPSFR